MQRSSERILTTHTGSLPRPAALLEALHGIEQGSAPDPEAFAEQVRDSVVEIVARQVEAGVDVGQRRRDGQGRLRDVRDPAA